MMSAVERVPNVIAESSNYCVCCGAEIPEGWQFCRNCWGKPEYEDYWQVVTLREAAKEYAAKKAAREQKIEAFKSKCRKVLGFLLPKERS